MSRPWGIHTVYSMWGGHGVACGLPNGRWVRAVCEPYHVSVESIRERFTAAWWVFTGRAFAVEWPKPGDLENVWHDIDPLSPKSIAALSEV